MQSTDPPRLPATFHQQYRTILVFLGILMTALSLLNVVIATGSRPLWLIQLFIWPSIAFITYRTRLVLTDEGLQYRSAFTTTHAKWSEVSSLVTRRSLGPLTVSVESLSVKLAGSAHGNHLFVPLAQFGRSWRQGQLGTMLRERGPHLFP